MFFTHFIISVIVSSFTVGMIMIFRKFFKNQLSAKWQYNLWLLCLMALTFPLIPNRLFEFGNYFSWDRHHPSHASGDTAASAEARTLNDNSWMQDFAVSVNRIDMTFLNEMSAFIWVTGVVVMLGLTIRGGLKLKYIKTTTSSLKNKEILILFEQCKRDVNISKQLIVGESPIVKSPLTFGLFKTYVVLPSHFEEWLSREDIKYIFLHELHHYKYKDIAMNYLIVFFQILYWFNPLVWIAFREMRLDREIACDIGVLNSLDKHDYKKYGYTIINFADRYSRPTYFTLVNQLNGSKEQMKKRMEWIASFTTESKRLKLKSIVIFMVLAVCIASQIPIVSAMDHEDNQYNFAGERTVYEDLSTYFEGVDGSFVLYDLQADQYSIYNKNKSTLRVSPNSTYKIYSALFALESNVITSEHSTMEWNGKQYPYDAWNRNQNLASAMEHSVNWYFQKLDTRVHRDTIQSYLKHINYGNYDLSGGITQYWLESSLKISPIEQVQLLKAFYTNNFGFGEENIQTVKEAIQLTEKNDAQLSGKTGTGNVNGKNYRGWFIGYVETKRNTYFFATTIQHENNATGSEAAEITQSILREKGVY
ncbi:BlaR1 family beta-lactam sensor/signal transducer [Salibacterium aidingense]|uniref:BlaR1 family beta-lactam sensor/signal transducer n=1 Tax=Salibacterium aidingense TaxID=384933 RepID=UPI00041759C1|nr:BlaR1 family beta-lactam sensor/signal transducer [Salibacterium aidingense]